MSMKIIKLHRGESEIAETVMIDEKCELSSLKVIIETSKWWRNWFMYKVFFGNFFYGAWSKSGFLFTDGKMNWLRFESEKHLHLKF